jgi:hypothetical protein
MKNRNPWRRTHTRTFLTPLPSCTAPLHFFRRNTVSLKCTADAVCISRRAACFINKHLSLPRTSFATAPHLHTHSFLVQTFKCSERCGGGEDFRELGWIKNQVCRLELGAEKISCIRTLYKSCLYVRQQGCRVCMWLCLRKLRAARVIRFCSVGHKEKHAATMN